MACKRISLNKRVVPQQAAGSKVKVGWSLYLQAASGAHSQWPRACTPACFNPLQRTWPSRWPARAQRPGCRLRSPRSACAAPPPPRHSTRGTARRWAAARPKTRWRPRRGCKWAVTQRSCPAAQTSADQVGRAAGRSVLKPCALWHFCMHEGRGLGGHAVPCLVLLV